MSTKLKKTPNVYQTIAADAYPDGSVHTALTTARYKGDTLAVFIAKELADCESMDEALGRMRMAEREINGILTALETRKGKST